MKKISASILLTISVFVGFHSVSAQGWNQDRIGIYSLGIGGTQAFYPSSKNGYYGTYRANLTAPGLSFNVNGDFKVHRFISVGFHTGINMFFYSPVAIGIPIAARGDAHILEACNLDIAKKLDAYAGMTVGGGPGFPLASGANAFGFLIVGPHGGVRYWIKPNIGVFAEVGWGATFLNGGVTF